MHIGIQSSGSLAGMMIDYAFRHNLLHALMLNIRITKVNIFHAVFIAFEKFSDRKKLFRTA